jgi:RNA polymerase sigma factor (sigma-70 family)
MAPAPRCNLPRFSGYLRVMSVNDEALMSAVREGDLAQLGPLFDRYHASLFDFLNRMTGNRHVAEDLVQEVFLRVLKYRATYREGARFATWVFSIARNVRTDYFSRREAAVPLSEEALEAPDAAPGPEGETEMESESGRLRAALLRLREDRRELLILARYQCLKHERIAELLGVDTGTVKVRVHRAIKELREIFLQMTERPSCDVKTSQRNLLII